MSNQQEQTHDDTSRQIHNYMNNYHENCWDNDRSLCWGRGYDVATTEQKWAII